MSKTRSLGRQVGFCAWLLFIVAGCAPTHASSRPAAYSPTAMNGGDAIVPQAGVISSPDDPNAVAVSSKIRKVTVYSDRALVSREGAVALAAHPTVYAFRHLPGWVDEGSVRV